MNFVTENKANIKLSKVTLGIIAFFIPVIILICVYSTINIYPFGEKCLLPYWDIREQYSNYFAYLKTIFLGNNDIFYSFSKTLGGNMIGLFAYYLSSPFNLLFLIFNKMPIVDVILILTLLKVGLCGVSFCVYLNHGKEADLKSLIFSSCYALTGYNIIYQQNPMWLDGVILLPIVCIGIDIFLEKNKPHLYIFSLALCIVSNYYIGYMVGIFSFLYFFYKLFLNSKIQKLYWKTFGKFLLCSILSVGLTSFLLIPTLLSLSGSKGPFSMGFKYFFDFSLINPFNFLVKFYPATFIWNDLMDINPFVFSGLLTFPLVVLFGLNKSINKREKILSFSLLFLMIISLNVTFFNTIWHGFNPPTGFPGRNSFILSFVILFLSYKSLLHINLKNSLPQFIAVLIFVLLCTIIIFNYYNLSTYKPLMFTCLSILSVYCVFIFLFSKIKTPSVKNYSILLLILLTSLELFFNANLCLSKYDFIKHDDLDTFVNENIDVVDFTKTLDDDFYRIEKTFSRTRNDNMLLNIPGITHYSSSEANTVKHFIGALGYEQVEDVYAAYGHGSNILADSLVGIRYLISHTDPGTGYELVKKLGSTCVFKNKYALPVAFLANKNILNKDFIDDDRFYFQNSTLQILSGNKEDVFKHVENYKLETENLKCSTHNKLTFYEKNDHKKPASINCYFTVDPKYDVYMDLWGEYETNAKVILNGKKFPNCFNGNRINIKKLPKNNEYSLKIDVPYRVIINSLAFYYLDTDALRTHTDILNTNKCHIKDTSSSTLVGEVSVNNDDEVLFMTIPFDKAWNIKIDGQTVNFQKVLYTLIAVPITKGHHKIEMNYIPSGFYLGLILTICSLIFFVFYSFKNKKSSQTS